MTTRRPTVLVVGDSASASLGVVESTYPELLAAGRLPIHVRNAALVGMTSADALACFPALLRDLAPGDAVVLCLGHCDAAGYGPLKPRFPVLGPSLRRLIQPWYQSLSPWSVRTSPFEFSPQTGDLDLLPCVPADEFEANLCDLVRAARSRRVKVILLNPFGRRWFPPANHTPCSLFIRLFGADEHHPFPASGGTDDVRHALTVHQAGQLEAARWLYGSLRNNADPTTRCLALNNEAEIAFSRGETERAIGLCGRASRETTPLAVLPAFNRALALRRAGFTAAADRAADAVLEADRGSYRITAAHRAAAGRVAEALEGPDLVYRDLAELLAPDDVIDYCHPTPSAHRRIAAMLEDVLVESLGIRRSPEASAGSFSARYGNPDSALGGDEDFFDHFHLRSSSAAAPPSELPRAASIDYERILAAASGQEAPPDGLDRSDLDTLSHPILGLPALLAAAPRVEPTDRGVAPSFYRLRLGASLLADAEARSRAVTASPRLDDLLPRASRIQQWSVALGIADKLVTRDLVKRAVADDIRSGKALERVDLRLARALGPENRPGNRWRTSRSWFFREALWFGTPSTPWIFCDREGIAAAAESLVVLDALAESASIRGEARRRLLELGNRLPNPAQAPGEAPREAAAS